MNVKLVLYIIIIVLGIIFGNGEDPNGFKRKSYIIIIISLLILESSLRSIYVGPDTIGYYYNFLADKENTWSDVWSYFKSSYVEGEGKDAGFLVFTKLVQLFTTDFHIFLFVCAIVFFVPMGVILYRYSTHILQLVFAFTLYVTLFNIVALSGIRQQLATGFSFMAFLQLGKKHYLKSLLLIIAGSFLHISLSFYLVVFAITLFGAKQVKTIHLFSFATIPLVIVFAGPIMLFIASFLTNDYYSTYGSHAAMGGGYTYIILIELLSLFCFIAIKKEAVCNSFEINILYVMLPLLTITAPLISLSGAMIRFGQYFTLYLMLLVPIAVDLISKGISRNLIYYVMILVLILSQNEGGLVYYFFWQQTQI